MISSRDPNLARQHPSDYIKGAEVTIKQALATAKKEVKGFSASQVIGIGVDTTGSAPRCLVPLCDGVAYNDLPTKEKLWDKYYTAAPARQQRCVERYNIVKRA